LKQEALKEAALKESLMDLEKRNEEDEY